MGPPRDGGRDQARFPHPQDSHLPDPPTFSVHCHLSSDSLFPDISLSYAPAASKSKAGHFHCATGRQEDSIPQFLKDQVRRADVPDLSLGCLKSTTEIRMKLLEGPEVRPGQQQHSSGS